MTLKICPVWAKSMVSNYRRMFKEAYGADSGLSDDVIYTIIETVHDDADPKNAENERVLEMFTQEYSKPC